MKINKKSGIISAVPGIPAIPGIPTVAGNPDVASIVAGIPTLGVTTIVGLFFSLSYCWIIFFHVPTVPGVLSVV